jgi:chemotaxis protein methyltransferase CheR
VIARSAAAPAPTAIKISRVEFGRFAAWIEAVAGIHLPERKASLLQRRLGGRLRALETASYDAYLQRLHEDTAERTLALDLISTNETSFFREPRQFELLAGTILPDWRQRADQGTRDTRIRAWCAACSSGEEPYTLAMLLLDAYGADPRWQLDILASDLSSRALAKATQGVFAATRVAGQVEAAWIQRYFLRGKNEQLGQLKVAPEVRRLVRFQSINLTADRYPVARGLDLVFCRNVLIYFRPESRRAVVERMFSLLRPGGYLFLGHAENIAGFRIDARSVRPSVYQKGEADAHPSRPNGVRP